MSSTDNLIIGLMLLGALIIGVPIYLLLLNVLPPFWSVVVSIAVCGSLFSWAYSN